MDSSDVKLRSPSVYVPIPATATPPSLAWLSRTWTVTHSTLPMWRSSRDVRISYSVLAPSSDARERNADRVEHVPISSGDGSDELSCCERLRAAPTVIEGVNTATLPGDASSWDWRGKGALFFVTSHWEVLGWGERTVDGGGDNTGVTERWAVTWFQKTLFSDEGVDVYCDRPEGISRETYALIFDALKGLEASRVADLVEKDMFAIKIKGQDAS